MKEIVAHFEVVDPVFAPVVEAAFAAKTPIALRTPASTVKFFENIAEAVVSQQLSVKAADTIWKRFTTLLEDKVTPKTVLQVDIEQMRAVGLSYQKAGYLKSIAESVLSGSVNLDRLPDLSDDEVIAELIKLKGIGPWTAEMFLMFTLGRPDVFSYLDLGLIRAFKAIYGVESATREIMEPYVLKWAPYRTYAALALWSHRDNKPL